MYKPSTCLLVGIYFCTYLCIYKTYFLQNLVTKVKPYTNSVGLGCKHMTQHLSFEQIK
jgi:hypothetical protein